jgi:hypothetical protein
VNREIAAERRIAPRVEARLPLQLTEPDTRLVVTTESVDLSRNGLACRTSEYLAPLSKVAVTVILPPFGNLSRASRSLRAEGVVVRCEQTPQADGADADREYDLACCFTGLEPDARNLLDAFVAWRLLRSVRSEEPRASASHGASHGGTHARGAPRARFGQRPRPAGGRSSGPRQGRSDFRGPREGSGRGPREGARSERGSSYEPRRSGEGGRSYPRGERGRPPSRHPRQGRAAPGHVGSDRPRTEKPYQERSTSGERRQGDRPQRGPEGRGDARGRESGARDRPPRGRFRTEGKSGDRRPRGRGRPGAGHERGTHDRPGHDRPARERGTHERGTRERPAHERGREGDSRSADREFRPRGAHEGHERVEREVPERSEGSPREEKRGRWGRRPARRSPNPRSDDPKTRRP